MRVRFEKMMAGPGGIVHPGTVLTIDDELAMELLRVNAVTPLPGLIERAIETVGEIRRRGRPRGTQSGDRPNNRSNDIFRRQGVAEG